MLILAGPVLPPCVVDITVTEPSVYPDPPPPAPLLEPPFPPVAPAPPFPDFRSCWPSPFV